MLGYWFYRFSIILNKVYCTILAYLQGVIRRVATISAVNMLSAFQILTFLMSILMTRVFHASISPWCFVRLYTWEPSRLILLTQPSWGASLPTTFEHVDVYRCVWTTFLTPSFKILTNFRATALEAICTKSFRLQIYVDFQIHDVYIL